MEAFVATAEIYIYIQRYRRNYVQRLFTLVHIVTVQITYGKYTVAIYIFTRYVHR